MNQEYFELLVSKLPNIERARSVYFNVDNYSYLINQYIEEKFLVDDLTIVPFYITDEITYEIYDYELNILQVEKPDINKFIMTKTGKNNLEDIEISILNKLTHCYFEIVPHDKTMFIEALSKYFDYLLMDVEIKKRIKDNFGKYSLKNLYFEIY